MSDSGFEQLDSSAVKSSTVNPFSPPNADQKQLNEAIVGIGPFPTTITVIAILFIVFGVFGCLSGLASIGSAFAMALVPKEMADDPNFAGMKAMSEMKFIPVGLGIANVVLSILFIIVGVGLVRKQRWGARLGVAVALGAILFKLLEAAGNAYAQLHSIPAVQESFAKSTPDANIDPMFFTVIAIFSVVMVVVFALAFSVFYGWVAYYLGREKNQAHLISTRT